MGGKRIDDDLADEWCFLCKDGGFLRVCDFKNCRKAYHHNCVERDKSFLDDDDDWECPWHLCYKCKKKAVFQCYGCPNRSVCDSCIKEDEFARVRRNSNKGFCIACLRLSILIEENADYDSDGEKVDFNDPNSEEYLFRDYWYTIKDSESISLSDLKSARRRLKQTGGENENMSEVDYEPDLEPEPDSSTSFLPEEESRKRKSRAKFTVDSLSSKKSGSKMRNFSKWASEELIDFVVSIGREGDVPLSQGDVERVVKEYIEKKNLYQPGKKKKFVLCDESLKALFGKGKTRVRFSRICKLLEEHFPGSQGDLIFLRDSDEEQEEESMVVKKRKISVGGPSHVGDIREGVLEGKKRCKATLVRENIKLIYLRRALVLRFLKENPDTFEQKIMGCFVRVKRNLKDFYVIPPNLYQIGRVTGVKKDAEMYQVGEVSTDIVISMSNIHKDIKLFSLADDDFSDEDVEDFRKLVLKGDCEMPTVGEVAEKLKYVHEDITGHWIEKELLRLTYLKKQANEKGWRRELCATMFDYINRIDMLRKPEEQERLKKEMPPILADPEEEKEEEKEETIIPSLSNSLPQIKGILADSEEEKEEENDKAILPSLSDSLAQNKGDANGKNTDNVARKPETSGERTVSGFDNVEENKEALRGNSAGEVPVEELSPKKTEINMAETNGNGLREESAGVKSLDSLKSDCSSNTNNAEETSNCFERPTEQPVQSNKDVKPNNTTQQVIELSDSDSDSEMPAEGEEVWYYLDPQEMVQGPFSMILLRRWKIKGFFDEDFKVWHKGQSRGDAILLSRASRYSF